MPDGPSRRLRLRGSRWAVIAAAIAVGAIGGTRAVPWAAAVTSAGDRAIFEPLTPVRILDTRSSSNPVGPGESRVLPVTGAGGVPGDATAVVINVTAVSPTSGGWLTLYPADGTLPVVSNVNFNAGQVVPNLVTVKLGSTGADTGRIKIFNQAGQTHVLVDVAGYYRGHDHDDRYYVKAQTQARIAGNSLTCTAGNFLRSVAADGTPTCAAGPTGPPGAPGQPGAPGPSGPKGFASASGAFPASGGTFYRIITNPFVVPAGVTSCLITSSAQTQPPGDAPSGTVYFRNAVTRNATSSEDGEYGQYLTNDGTGRKQAAITRSSVMSVSPGESVSFGAFFGSLNGTWFGAGLTVVTSYLCS
jgi:hypothetical protein